jgi:hypothetical protein
MHQHSQTVETIALGITAAIGAVYVMWWAKEYVQAFLDRQGNEPLLETARRARKERELNRQAKIEMLGGRWATLISLVVNVGFWLLLAKAALIDMRLFWALVAYDCVGFWLTRGFNFGELPHCDRLTWSDRIWARWTHANLWPVHLFLKRPSRKPTNAR